MNSPDAMRNYLSNLNALVVDSVSASRNTFRKILLELGVKPTGLNLCENLHEAGPIFAAQKPTLVIAEQLRGSQSAFKAFEITREQYPNRLDTIFIVTAEGENPFLLNRVEDEDIDGLLSRPFTYSAVHNRISELVHTRLNISGYQRILSEGRTRLNQGMLKDAITDFRRARELDASPSQAWCLEGHARRRLGQHKESLPCFEQALKFDPRDYRALSGVVDSHYDLNDFNAAYEASRRLMSEHVLRPLRIPALIRVAVRTGKFEDVLGFYDKIAKLEEPEGPVVSAVTAGLLVCAKHFLQKGNREAAGATLKKAALASTGQQTFTRELAATMIEVGMINEAAALLAHAPVEIRESIQVRMAEFRHASRVDSPSRVVEMGMGFIKAGMRDPQLYEVVIVKSLELKRRREIIEELVIEASRSFPEHAAAYQELIQNAS